MNHVDDERRLTFRRSEALDLLAAAHDEDPPAGAPSVLAQTVNLGSYPTAAQRFYAVKAVQLLGTEVEGGSGSAGVVTPDPFYAYNLGGTVPVSGTQVIVTFVASRWVFRYDA